MPTRALAVTAVTLVVASASAADWSPHAFVNESTLELKTVAAGEGEHWFPVWLAVIGDELYVRLGPRAAGRIERNTTAPYVGLRIAGQEFPRVRGIPAPEKAQAVAQAMAEKYWSDVVIRHFNHPLTLRLVPEPAASP